MYSTFLFSSIIIIQLLSAGLRKELNLLPVSERRKSHTLVLNFGGWTFWHNCNQILQTKIRSFKRERILLTNRQEFKNVTQRGVGQRSATNYIWVMKGFLEPALLFYGWKGNIKIRFWKKFCQKTSFHSLQKVPKSKVPNIMAKYLP